MILSTAYANAIFLCLVLFNHKLAAVRIIPTTVQPSDPEAGICPTQEETKETLENIQTVIKEFKIVPECGRGVWFQVAHLNMSDSSQNCPPPWTEYSTSRVRTCDRPDTSLPSCAGVFFPTSHKQYSNICGRVIGYQRTSPDAFDSRRASNTIDSYYVFGVSITYGSPRKHVWTYASGFVEQDNSGCPECVCPCINPSNPRTSHPPSFVGNNYYCESGNPGPGWSHDHLYYTDPLWDGKQCTREGQCCSDSRYAPWFSVALERASSDDIEVRICSMEGSHDETPVQLLELYVK